VKIESRWFLVPFVGFLAANANASPSMCLDGENTIFNCELKGAVASLCISRTNDLLAYRKGTPGKLELVLDEKRFGTGTVFLLSNAQYAGGYESHIRFSNGSVTYLLYDKSVKRDNGPEASVGIVVYNEGQKIANLSCENNASISAEAYEAMRQEDFNAIQTQ
jgi:hypothetical protein